VVSNAKGAFSSSLAYVVLFIYSLKQHHPSLHI
jgi:hypothetical protein